MRAIESDSRCDGTRVASLGAVCLSMLALVAACASPYRTSGDVQARERAIHAVGVLPPLIAAYDEHANLKLTPRPTRSHAAVQVVQDAFVQELAANGMAAIALASGDPEIEDVLDLFSVVDFSIQRHAFGAAQEDFGEQQQTLDYSLGSIEELARKHSIDALWIVAATDLEPSTGAQLGDVVTVLGAIASGISGTPAVGVILPKLVFRAALVNRDGAILFFGTIDEATALGPAKQRDESVVPDLRDPRFARLCVRALLEEHRRAIAP